MPTIKLPRGEVRGDYYVLFADRIDQARFDMFDRIVENFPEFIDWAEDEIDRAIDDGLKSYGTRKIVEDYRRKKGAPWITGDSKSKRGNKISNDISSMLGRYLIANDLSLLGFIKLKPMGPQGNGSYSTCHVCSRKGRVDASYCYNCGTKLEAA